METERATPRRATPRRTPCAVDVPLEQASRLAKAPPPRRFVGFLGCVLYIYIYIYYVYTHLYIHTYLPTYLPTYLRTYVRTYIHTYIVMSCHVMSRRVVS